MNTCSGFYYNGQNADESVFFDKAPAQVWRLWKAQKINAGQLSAWQQRNNYYFNESGGQILARRLFHRLERDSFTPGRYLVLNDGRYFASIYAENDLEAVERFQAGEYGEV